MDIGPGDVVVVVNDQFLGGLHSPFPPLGSRQVAIASHMYQGQPCLIIQGWPNTWPDGNDDGWHVRRFRKAESGDHHETIRNALNVRQREQVDA